MLSPIWYAFCVLPTIGGAMLAIDQCHTIERQITGMPRMVIPGRATFELAAGDYELFGESEAYFQGDLYENDDFTFDVPCTVADTNGWPVELRRRSTKKYKHPYRGRSMHQFEIETAGRYIVECEGDGTGRALVAVGNAQSTLSVFWFLALLVGGVGSGAFCALWVYNRRDSV